jgi:hypothetical protein
VPDQDSATEKICAQKHSRQEGQALLCSDVGFGRPEKKKLPLFLR